MSESDWIAALFIVGLFAAAAAFGILAGTGHITF